jgi:hypothetical protein
MVPRCGKCHSSLSVGRWIALLLSRRELSYPFRYQDGRRVEQALRWLCASCDRRADRLRRKAEAGDAGD